MGLTVKAKKSLIPCMYNLSRNSIQYNNYELMKIVRSMWKQLLFLVHRHWSVSIKELLKSSFQNSWNDRPTFRIERKIYSMFLKLPISIYHTCYCISILWSSWNYDLLKVTPKINRFKMKWYLVHNYIRFKGWNCQKYSTRSKWNYTSFWKWNIEK